MSDFSDIGVIDDVEVSDSCSLSDDDISLPPELLEREKQLMEKNQQLEQRVKDILKQSIDSEDSISKKVRAKKHGKTPANNIQDFQTLPSENNDYDVFLCF